MLERIATLSALLVLSGCQSAPSSAQISTSPAGHAQVCLDNGLMRLWVYLPDNDTGYYRGPRFDPSGIVHRVECDGHVVFGERKAVRNPNASDDVCGTAEEFDLLGPESYEKAGPGDPFMKIAVGQLRRIDDAKYWFPVSYPVVARPTWTTAADATSVTFTCTADGPGGRAYRYVKRIELTAERREFRIVRTLTNTGQSPLATEHYSHHFVQLDNTPVGPEYRVHYAEPVRAAVRSKLAPARIEGAVVTFDAALPPGAAVRAQLSPTTSPSTTVELVNSRIALEILPEYFPSQLVFYAEPAAVCPEVFLRLKLDPRESRTWATTYRLATKSE